MFIGEITYLLRFSSLFANWLVLTEKVNDLDWSKSKGQSFYGQVLSSVMKFVSKIVDKRNKVKDPMFSPKDEVIKFVGQTCFEIRKLQCLKGLAWAAITKPYRNQMAKAATAHVHDNFWSRVYKYFRHCLRKQWCGNRTEKQFRRGAIKKLQNKVWNNSAKEVCVIFA